MNPWTCPECPKTFSRKGDLTRHSLLHTGYRPYVCSDCGKSFAQHSGLRTHMNVHTRNKPFRCGISPCQAAFGDPSSCARHRKETHRHKGAYQCPENRCKSSIKRRSAFTAHLRKHGMKYMGVDIENFYYAVAHGPRVTTRQLGLSNVAESIPPDNTTYETQPTYNSYIPHDMLAYTNDYSNQLDLHVSTGELFAFSSPSPDSLSPSSLASSSSSPSASPSPSPLEFPDEHAQFGLSYVNIAAANAPHDPGMSGAYPTLSPVSQLMFVYDCNVSEYNNQLMGWA